MRNNQNVHPPPLRYNWHFCDWHLRQTRRAHEPLVDWSCIRQEAAPRSYRNDPRLYFSYHLALARSEYPSSERADS